MASGILLEISLLGFYGGNSRCNLLFLRDSQLLMEYTVRGIRVRKLQPPDGDPTVNGYDVLVQRIRTCLNLMRQPKYDLSEYNDYKTDNVLYLYEAIPVDRLDRPVRVGHKIVPVSPRLIEAALPAYQTEEWWTRLASDLALILFSQGLAHVMVINMHVDDELAQLAAEALAIDEQLRGRRAELRQIFQGY